jgi:carbon monoxide dehydrogenase subunit G
MVTATKQFQIRGDLKSVWSLINNPNELGACIPGCEEVVVVNDTESRWKVKMSVGVISRRINARARVTQKVDPEKLDISLETIDGDIKGKFLIALSPKDLDTTTVNFTADIEAKGSFQWVVNQVVKSQLDGFIDKFNQCVSKKLESN